MLFYSAVGLDERLLLARGRFNSDRERCLQEPRGRLTVDSLPESDGFSSSQEGGEREEKRRRRGEEEKRGAGITGLTGNAVNVLLVASQT